MPDQATELRRLVREAHAAGSAAGCARARLVTVVGGKGGVGTTTIAANLAVILADPGRRAVLADVSPNGSGSAILCRLPRRHTVADVLAGSRGVEQALEAGPSGVRVLGGQWGAGEVGRWAGSAEKHLVDQFQDLGPIADFVVIDAGNSPTSLARRLWHASDLVLLVATPELASVMNAYAAVKGLAERNSLASLYTVVNMAVTEGAADEVHARLAKACRRFLGMESQTAGYVSYARQVEEAGRRGEPFVLASPDCRASHQIAQLARLVAGS